MSGIQKKRLLGNNVLNIIDHIITGFGRILIFIYFKQFSCVWDLREFCGKNNFHEFYYF